MEVRHGKQAADASKWDLAMESYRQARSAAQAAGDRKSESLALSGMASTASSPPRRRKSSDSEIRRTRWGLSGRISA
jgi:hypothetical protein